MKNKITAGLSFVLLIVLFSGLMFSQTAAVAPVTVVKEKTAQPEKFKLNQNYPNPFNPMTTINFGIPKASYVTLKVYNILSQEVAVLVDGEIQAGVHHLRFNATHLVSGVYFYRLQTSDYVETKKFLLMR